MVCILYQHAIVQLRNHYNGKDVMRQSEALNVKKILSNFKGPDAVTSHSKDGRIASLKYLLKRCKACIENCSTFQIIK